MTFTPGKNQIEKDTFTVSGTNILLMLRLLDDDSDTLLKRRINKIFVPETANVSFSTWSKIFPSEIHLLSTPGLMSKYINAPFSRYWFAEHQCFFSWIFNWPFSVKNPLLCSSTEFKSLGDSPHSNVKTAWEFLLGKWPPQKRHNSKRRWDFLKRFYPKCFYLLWPSSESKISFWKKIAVRYLFEWAASIL